MQDKAYIIEVATYHKGKLTNESGFIPEFYLSKELVEKSIRIKARREYQKLPEKMKARMQSSFSSDAIFKGGIRIYFKDGYTEFKPFECSIVKDEKGM